MGFIIFDKIKNNNKKIMIFVEGTILRPKHDNFISRICVTSYVPIGNAVKILSNWQEQGYEIIFLTSLKGRKAMKMADHLDELGFNASMLGYRQRRQNYATLIKEEMPDILIEDDCKSIGEENMCYLQLSNELRRNIKHIVVEEFKGIDDVKLY